MSKSIVFVSLIVGMLNLSSKAQEEVPAIELEEIASGYTAPLAGSHAGDGNERLFVVDQVGKIYVIEDGEQFSTPFLDISDKLVNLNTGYDERGLLGLAFHPQYESNGRFYVYYSAPGGKGNHQSILAEYMVSEDDSTQAADQERVIMRIDQPEGNHNGGHIVFGPDGMLYVGLGDGGGAGDQHGNIGNGQDLNTLLGSILRIDVDGEAPYEVPEDNPFVGVEGRDEIWAYGLRNPWKFSFDFEGNNRLFCGDVGQNEWEEIDIIEKGGNYGWRVMEGSHCYNPPRDCDTSGKILPIAEYSHRVGISVTGGYVYRGKRYSSLYGKYVFGDYNGSMFLLEEDSNEWTMHELEVTGDSPGMRILGFMEDHEGELYALTTRSSGPSGTSGNVYQITVPGDEPVRVKKWDTF